MGNPPSKMLRAALVLVLAQNSLPAPQFFNGVSNLLTRYVGGGEGDQPGEVEDYENAPYNVINSFDGYEERFYPSTKWVCTRTGRFMDLFGYISGENSQKQKIEMTVPVLSTYSEKGKEMCFWLPSAFQSSTPQPTASNIYIDRKKDMTVFAKTMGGYPNGSEEASIFKDPLQRGKASEVDFSFYMTMGYDSPWKVINRRNDILYKKL